MNRRRLAFAAIDAARLYDVRVSLVAEAVRHQHHVVIFCETAAPDVARALQDLGATIMTGAFRARGLNPFAPMRVRRDWAARLKAAAPHTLALCDREAIETFAPLVTKARALASTAPRLVAMPTRTDLRGVVADARLLGLLDGMAAIVVETMEECRTLAARCAALDDRVCAPAAIVAVPSATVDVARTPVVPLPSLVDGFRFALVTDPADTAARALFDRAADELRRSSTARLVALDGDAETARMEQQVRACHIAVHAASDGRLSHGLLTALAMGRPVITTDAGASAEAVDERVNGWRFRAGDGDDLTEALVMTLKRMDLLPAMARASRLKAERRFDRTLNDMTLLNLLTAPIVNATARPSHGTPNDEPHTMAVKS